MSDEGRPGLVAVDGPSGAGKSTFAARLARALDAPVVPMDDFVSWDDFAGWWPRLEEQVLAPYLAGRPVTYQRRDWTGDPLGGGLGAWRELPTSRFLVLEGVTSSRREVADRLDYAVWVDAPRAVRLRRGVDRDGHEMRPRWLSWMEREVSFFDQDNARDRADLRVNGDPSTAMSEDEYEVGT
jgi:uridine kinase